MSGPSQCPQCLESYGPNRECGCDITEEEKGFRKGWSAGCDEPVEPCPDCARKDALLEKRDALLKRCVERCNLDIKVLKMAIGCKGTRKIQMTLRQCITNIGRDRDMLTEHLADIEEVT